MSDMGSIATHKILEFPRAIDETDECRVLEILDSDERLLAVVYVGPDAVTQHLCNYLPLGYVFANDLLWRWKP